MYTWLIFLALLWPLLWVVRVLLVTRALLGLEFCATRIKALPPAGVPPHLQEAAKPWITPLEALGFRRLGGWQLGSTVNPAFDDQAVVLERATPPMRAIVQPYGESARSGECWLSLRTTKRDGTEIITASHAPEELLPLAPGIETEVLEAATPDELVKRHLARVAPLGADAWRCPDIQSAAVREQHYRDATLGFAYANGAVAHSDGGGFSYQTGAALRRAVLVIRRAAQQKKAQRPAAQRSVVATISPESLLEFDLQHYRQRIALSQGRFSLKAKTIITSLSFVAFAGVLAWQYSFVAAVTLIVALIIHECGHLLGMRWCGYRDTQLLFVPFFGGAAVSHDDRVLSPWKHIVIILLGPIPGIFLGLALLVYASGGGAPAWITQVAITMLVLNAFNLLPILPLDGGQIVDYAVASRFPRARVVFLAMSAIAMVLLGLGAGGAKILFGLGIATLIRLPVEWRLAGLRRAVREEFPDGGEEEPIVRRLVREVRAPEWNKTPMVTRLQLVVGLQRALRMPRAGWGTMGLALAGFTSPLWLGAPMALWAVARQGEAEVRQAYAKAEAAGLTHAPAVAKATAVAPEENAAVPYEEAAALLGHETEEEDAPASVQDPAQKEKIVTLLRAAAQRRVFVPAAVAAKGAAHPGLAGWRHSGLVGHLTQAATERLRYHEGAEAAALAIDGLKLLRLMQAAPDFLAWYEYKYLADECWVTVEEVLASGVKLPAGQVAELRRLCAEGPDLAFAATAIPRGLLKQTNIFDEADLPEGSEGTLRWLHLVQSVNPVWTRSRVESIDQAVVAHGLMQGVARGEWPKPVVAGKDRKDHPLALFNVAQLGDFLARQRQARVALLLVEQRQRGAKVASLEKLGAEPAELLHPYTREPMQLVRRGSLDVLSFAGGAARTVGGDEMPGQATLLWRLPAEAN